MKLFKYLGVTPVSRTFGNEECTACLVTALRIGIYKYHRNDWVIIDQMWELGAINGWDGYEISDNHPLRTPSYFRGFDYGRRMRELCRKRNIVVVVSP